MLYRATITYEDTLPRGGGLPHRVVMITVDGTYAEVIERAEQLGRLPETLVVSVALVRTTS